MKKRMIIYSIIILLIDQFIKFFIVSNIKLNDYKFIIKNFFYLTYTKNTGAAWSILENNILFLIIITIIAIIFIYYFFIKDKKLTKFEIITYSILMGGILGNFFDRIFYGYVIDYIGIIFGQYYYPIFNFADSCIVISCCLIILNNIRGEKREISSK